VVNTGLHFSATYEQDLQELVRWRRQQRTAAPFLIWKDTPAQHFDQVRVLQFGWLKAIASHTYTYMRTAGVPACTC
jgi:hypothetical protein